MDETWTGLFRTVLSSPVLPSTIPRLARSITSELSVFVLAGLARATAW